MSFLVRGHGTSHPNVQGGTNDTHASPTVTNPWKNNSPDALENQQAESFEAGGLQVHDIHQHLLNTVFAFPTLSQQLLRVFGNHPGDPVAECHAKRCHFPVCSRNWPFGHGGPK